MEYFFLLEWSTSCRETKSNKFVYYLTGDIFVEDDKARDNEIIK